MKIFHIVFRLKNGFSLIEVLVALGVMSIAGMALMSMNVTAMKANKSSNLRVDLADIKRTITDRISCDATLGATKPTSINGAVTLKDKDGIPLTRSGGKIGEWTIEATVESLGTPATPGLSIYATKPGKIDPLRNIPLDKNHPISALFNPDARPCGENFNSSMTSMPPIVTAVRIGGKPFTGTSIIAAVNYGNNQWGMECLPPYLRTGCFMRSASGNKDADIKPYGDSGCTSDQEEWSEGNSLYMICLKLK